MRTLHIEILIRHAVVWHCTHAHCTEGVAGEASKEAINFKCSLEQAKFQTFVAALLATISIWAVADAIIKVFAH